jgi:hypothetical protein
MSKIDEESNKSMIKESKEELDSSKPTPIKSLKDPISTNG